jgi:tetratricopeptide (TPR) repeat protein
VREAKVAEVRQTIPHYLFTFQEGMGIWEIVIESLDASNPSHHSVLGFAHVDKGLCQANLGHYEEGRQSIERGLDLLYKTDDTESIVKGLADLAFNAWMTGDYAKSKEIADKGLSLARQHGDTEGIRWVLLELANVVNDLEDFPNKEQFYLQTEVEMRQIENRQLVVFLQLYSFFLLHRGDLEKARALATESLNLTRQTEYVGMEPIILDCLGMIAYKQGDYQKAQTFFLEAFAYPEEDKPIYFNAYLLANLGKLATALGNYARAKEYLKQSLDIGFTTKSSLNMTGSLVPLAELSMAHEQPQQAAEWLSLSLHHPATQWHEKREAKRLLDALKRQLSAKELKAAIERGKRLDLIAVVQDILVEL